MHYYRCRPLQRCLFCPPAALSAPLTLFDILYIHLLYGMYTNAISTEICGILLTHNILMVDNVNVNLYRLKYRHVDEQQQSIQLWFLFTFSHTLIARLCVQTMHALESNSIVTRVMVPIRLWRSTCIIRISYLSMSTTNHDYLFINDWRMFGSHKIIHNSKDYTWRKKNVQSMLLFIDLPLTYERR